MIAAKKIKFGENGGASFSPCERYRYSLWRRWDMLKPPLLWILLNPSTADQEQIDPTVRRCINYTMAWNYGGIHLLNIFALRATDPTELYQITDPIGPENDNTIKKYLRIHSLMKTSGFSDGRVVIAWGAHGAHLDRGAAVLRLIAESAVDPICLKKTKSGHPGHPLYLRADLKATPWS